ncbi:hypothetical protein, partial [Phocaeicola vulgatus]
RKKEGTHTKTADGKQEKTEKKQARRTIGHRKPGQGKEWTGKQLRKTQYDIHNTQVSFQKLLPLLKNSRKEKAEKNVLIQVRANQSLNVKFIKKTTYFAPPPLPHIYT